MLELCKLFLIFLMFSFLGWIIEVIFARISLKKYVNRGFLIGPICPIYGVGGVLIILLLSKYKSDMACLFILSVVVCSIVEYLVSLILEKIFKIRWWDYSNMKLNINGRICVETLIPFGLLGLFISYIASPLAYKLINHFSIKTIYIVSISLLIVLFVDCIFSLIIVNIFKDTAEEIDGDSSEMLSVLKNSLINKSYWTRRLVNSYPNFKVYFKNFSDNVKNTTKKVKDNVKSTTVRVKDNVKKTTEKVKSNVKRKNKSDK